MYQEGQTLMTGQKVEAKAKAPPPSLQDEDEKEAERKRIHMQFLTNLNQATKAQRDAKVKAPQQALQNQQRPEKPKYNMPLPSKQDKFMRELEEANRIRKPGEEPRKAVQEPQRAITAQSSGGEASRTKNEELNKEL